MAEESDRGRIFTIADPNARLRKASALDEFITTPSGNLATIADGTNITVRAVRLGCQNAWRGSTRLGAFWRNLRRVICNKMPR